MTLPVKYSSHCNIMTPSPLLATILISSYILWHIDITVTCQKDTFRQYMKNVKIYTYLTSTYWCHKTTTSWWTKKTRNTFCRTHESVQLQCNFFIFDHVTFNQFKICCCVQNFMKIRWFFTEIWRYNDFQNGGRRPSWNCFTTIRDHPRSLCCWP